MDRYSLKGIAMLLLFLPSCTIHSPLSGDPVICFQRKCRTKSSTPSGARPKPRIASKNKKWVLAKTSCKPVNEVKSIASSTLMLTDSTVQKNNTDFEIIKNDVKEVVIHVYFDFGIDSLSIEDSQKLSSLYRYIISSEYKNLTVEGHTDNVGSREYNKILSENRALRVANFLSLNKIARDKIQSRGLGMESPDYDNNIEEGRRLNRRVRIIISK